MAASKKTPQKIRQDYNFDKETYDNFARMCSKKGMAPTVVLERMMQKYNRDGQI